MNNRLDSIRATAQPPAKLRGEIPVRLQPEWLSDAVRESVHRERGHAKAIAAALNVSEGAVTDVADPARRVSLKAYWIPAIVAETGSFAILDALERVVGRVAFPLPPAASTDHADIVTHAGQSMQQTGEAIARVASAIVDGTITERERDCIAHEIDEAHAALAALQAVIDRKAVAA